MQHYNQNTTIQTIGRIQLGGTHQLYMIAHFLQLLDILQPDVLDAFAEDLLRKTSSIFNKDYNGYTPKAKRFKIISLL